MTYYPLPLQFMQESGASLLKAIQNDSMLPLDLLVREAVQNSLDAAIEGVGGEVLVDLSIRNHVVDDLLVIIKQGLDTKELRRKFSGPCQLLEIRDSRTQGLTGPLSLQELKRGQEHGNLLKLVYEIGKSHGEGTSGGSWGLGKTCFFRVGAGFVLYYSRIRSEKGSGYEERLAACLVEDERSPRRIQKETATGIAWWGGRNGIPVTNKDEIQAILKQLGSSPFRNEETGTAIIIPFLKDNLLPVPDPGEEESPSLRRPWWFEELKDYLIVSLQRWFCARIDNAAFRLGPRLVASVNGVRISRGSMLPVFQAIQALYARLSGGDTEYRDYLTQHGIDNDSIRTAPVRMMSTFRNGSLAGNVAFIRLSEDQLEMDWPNNIADPLTCIFGSAIPSTPRRPIVSFMRRHGMVVRWDMSSDVHSWSGGFPGLADGRYLLALFVPNPEQILSEAYCRNLNVQATSLESYLRSCEKADHSQWNDLANFMIVGKIKKKVGALIKEYGSVAIPPSSSVPAMRMARNLGDLLLRRGFGSDGRYGSVLVPRSAPTGANRGRKHASPPGFEVTSLTHAASGLAVTWRLTWGKGSVPLKIELGVDSEHGPISAVEWQDDGLGKFPFTITAIEEIVSYPNVPEGRGIKIHESRSYMIIEAWHDQMDGAWIAAKTTIDLGGALGTDFSPVLALVAGGDRGVVS